jgi:hypothetical protein
MGKKERGKVGASERRMERECKREKEGRKEKEVKIEG